MGYSNGLYIEINLICVLVLFRILKKYFFDTNRQYEIQMFVNVLLTSIIFFLADMGWIFLGYLCPTNITASYIVNIIYFITSGLIGFTWLCFCEVKMGYVLKDHKKLLLASLIPLLVLIVVTLSCPVTHAIFYVDENNVYHRGPLHILQVCCMNVYFVITCIHAIIKTKDKNEIANKNQYLTFCFFIIWAIGAQIIQCIIPGYPTISIGITMALFNVFIEHRDSVISLDPLTQINNRNQMLKFISHKFRNHIDYIRHPIHLLIMDVDYFKSINDNFGHLEGDTALKTIANSLKKCAGKNNTFICRYGGDEFIMICEKFSEPQIKEICKEIQQTVKQDNINLNKPYDLEISIGYACRSAENNSIPELIKAADKQLYIQKESRKKGRSVKKH